MKTITVQMDVTVPIGYEDVVAWLTECENPNVLRTISAMAEKFARQLYVQNTGRPE